MSAVPSGLPLLFDRIHDEDMRQQVISDWVAGCPNLMLAECVPALKQNDFKAALASIFLTETDKADMYCLSRFLLASLIAKSLHRRISTADLVYACISELPDIDKLTRIRSVLGLDNATTWEELKKTGFPLYIVDQQELRRICTALSRSAHSLLVSLPPEEKNRARPASQEALFWAVVAGCSPRGVLAWKRELDWSENQPLTELLSADWATSAVREKALKAAVGHKSKSEFLFSAVLLMWLGDLKTACRDCLFRGLGDWQLALFVADLRGDDETWLQILSDLNEELCDRKGDPWMGFSLQLRKQKRIGDSPFELKRFLDVNQYFGSSPRQSPRRSRCCIISTPTSPALQELDIIVSRKGYFK